MCCPGNGINRTCEYSKLVSLTPIFYHLSPINSSRSERSPLDVSASNSLYQVSIFTQMKKSSFTLLQICGAYIISCTYSTNSFLFTIYVFFFLIYTFRMLVGLHVVTHSSAILQMTSYFSWKAQILSLMIWLARKYHHLWTLKTFERDRDWGCTITCNPNKLSCASCDFDMFCLIQFILIIHTYAHMYWDETSWIPCFTHHECEIESILIYQCCIVFFLCSFDACEDDETASDEVQFEVRRKIE